MRRPGSRPERRDDAAGRRRRHPRISEPEPTLFPVHCRPTCLECGGGRRSDHVRTHARSDEVRASRRGGRPGSPRAAAVSVRSRTALGATTSSWSPWRSTSFVARHERAPLAHDERRRWPPPAAAARTPARRRSATPARCRSRAARPRGRSSGVVSTARSTRWWAVASPSRRATQGSVGACTRVKMTTSTNTRSKIHVDAGRAHGDGHRREHDRHRTAQPGPRQEGLGAPRHPERQRTTRAPTAGGRAAAAPPRRRGPARARRRTRRARRAARAARTARSARATRSPSRTRARPAGAGAQVAEHERREVAGEEPGGVQRRRRRRTRAPPPRRRRSRTAPTTSTRPGRSSRAPPHPIASPMTAPPTSSSDRDERRPATTGRRSRRGPVPPAMRGDEQHDRRVVEARLGLEHPRDAAGAAAPGAARRTRPRHPSRRARRRRGRRSATTTPSSTWAATPTTSTDTATPTVASTAAGRDRPADAGPPGRDAALDEDEDEGGVAEHLGQLLVVVAGCRSPPRPRTSPMPR